MTARETKLLVLLATQDEKLMTTTEQVCNNRNLSVAIAETCQEVLEFILDSTFDVIILDPELKELDGFGLVQLVKKRDPALPIVTVLDDMPFASETKLAETGVFFRLAKPQYGEELQELLRAIRNRGKSLPD